MDYEIRHWGILGQKHGRRRYQYEDGTYTEEGKARRRKDYIPYDEWSDDAKNYEKLRRKDPRTMTNKELAEFNARNGQLEKYGKANPSTVMKYIAAGTAAVGVLTGIFTTVNSFYSATDNFARNGSNFAKKFAKAAIK